MGAANATHMSFTASAAITAKRLVKFTGNAGEVAPATAATDKIAGAADLGATAAGQMVDVAISGQSEAIAGGNIAAGDKLTSDANGKAVAATLSAAATKHVFGVALAPGVDGDIIPYLVAHSVIAG